MKEINEIIEYLQKDLVLYNVIEGDNSLTIAEAQKQLDNANKVAAKLQGAIDLFKEIEEL
jgi:hypothetical protein|tara:strand:+ start:1324 stop:1503 length:180 start_codon:yes stop_codon:yes gene_type:complete